MNRVTNREWHEHYKSFFLDLKENWGENESFLIEIESDLKSCFKKNLGFCCLVSNLLPKELDAFSKAIVEESYCLNIMFAKGFFNSGLCILRQFLETTLKIIYFSSHPVELSWTMSREGYREINYSYLMEYISKTEEFHEINSEVNISQRISNEYAILSQYVHCHNPFIHGSKISKTKSEFKRNLSQITKKNDDVISILSLLLGVYFSKKWNCLSAGEKSLSFLSLKTSDKDYYKKFLAK